MIVILTCSWGDIWMRFYLLSLIIISVEHLFMHLVIIVYHLWKNVIPFSVFLIRLFTFLIFSCMSWLYILDINLLLVISFTNIFYNSIECLFISLIVSFAVRKVLCLIRSQFSFAFVYFALGNRSKKIAKIYVKEWLIYVSL